MTAVIWTVFDRRVDLGFLPGLINEDDPRPVKEQLDDTYRHGGGWNPMGGWRLSEDRSLNYPNDPPMKPLAMTTLRHETLLFYPHAFLCVLQPDGSFEVSRVD
jgi:hypothetical protein